MKSRITSTPGPLLLARFAASVLVFFAGFGNCQAQVTNSVSTETLSAGLNLSIPAGTVTLSTGTLYLNANTSANPSACVTGSGSLELASTTNNATAFPDIFFNASDTVGSTANWGSSINAPLILGSLQTYYIWGMTDHAGVGEYGLTEADCQFNGSISGPGGLTFIAQDAYTGSNPMETPFCLNAANTFTGPVQIQRGSVYVGNASGFPAGDELQFNVSAGLNGKFFLYGNNVTVANLTSTGAGNAVIANANRNPSKIAAATLTIQESVPTTYSGTLINSNIEYSTTGGTVASVLSVVKTGPATLTLTGTNKYSGSLTVNAGKLYLNVLPGSFVGPVMVTNGATLGGSALIATNVTVANGSALEAGGGAGAGILTMKSLVLGAVASDALRLNLGSTVAGLATSFAVTNLNGLTNNGTTMINISGVLPAANPATYTLLTYSGAIAGNGTFVLGAIPNWQTTAYITNNTSASALQLVVPLYIAPSVTWIGTPANDWDLTGVDNWLITGTATPAAYADGDTAVFDDTARNFNVNLAATVQPYSLVFSNFLNNYTVAGSGTISNIASLSLEGSATVTLDTANVYTGNTTVGNGTLVLGTAGAIPGGPSAGSVTVNGTLDLAGFSPVLNNLAGTGTVDDVTAGGSPVLTVSDTASSTFSGTLQNTTGSIALNKTGAGTLALGANNTYAGGTTIAGGALSITGPGGLGAGPVNVTANLAGGTASFLTVATSAAATLTNNLTLPNASGTYVLTKNAGGQLTLAGSLSGGGPDTVLRTTTGTAGDTSTVFEFAGPNAYAGGLQTYRGVVQVDNPTAVGTGTIYGDGNASTLGDLSFTNSMTLANPLVLQSATSLSPNNNNVVLTGAISGSGALTKYGAGSLTLGGPLSYVGTTTAAAGTLNVLGSLNSWQNQPLDIASGAVVNAFGLLNINVNENGNNTGIGAYGPGQLNLASTNSSAANPDIYFGPDHSGTAYWGAAIAAPVNLGAFQRFIYGKTGHNGVGQYTFTNADAQFRGTISGTGGLTIIAQMTWTASTPYMEVPFILMASNSFSGPLEIQRGSVYLGNTYALTQTNVLFLNPAAGNNARLFLYGTNATVGSLSSSTNGASVIANGNEKTGATLNLPAATLTVWQSTNGTFAGSLQDTQPEYDGSGSGTTGPLNLTKYGPATLTLAGSNSFTGTLSINQGTLLVDGFSTGGGLVTVGSGAFLGGNGIINSVVVVTNTGTLVPGNASGFGAFTLNNLALGILPGDKVSLDFTGFPGGIADAVNVTSFNGLTNNGAVAINLGGVTPSAPGSYTLMAYSGSVQGNGTFALGTLPVGCTGYLTNNAAVSALQLVVTSVNLPQVTWVGYPLNTWDELGSNVWVNSTNGTPASYADGNLVAFDDTATNFLVNLTTAVAPGGVLVTNNANNYVIMGNGQIAGYTGLTKAGTGTLTLATTNSYQGATTIAAGTLSLGAAGAIPSGAGAGNVILNGILDVDGFTTALNNLSGSGMVDNLNGGGSPVLILTNGLNTVFSGVIQNTSGSLELNELGGGTLTLAGNNTYSGVTVINGGGLQIGSGGNAGTLGTGGVLDESTLVFDRADTNTVPNNIAGSGSLQQNGTGTVTLTGNLTYTGPTIVNSGTLVFPKDVTFDAGAGATLTVASNAVVETGFEVFLNGNVSSVAVDIAGAGTTRLISTLNRIESYADMVIGANNNGVSTANYGIRIASGLDLGSTERLFWAYSSRDDVATYGLTGCDCQFAGPISGSAQLQLLGENSWAGVNTLEEQFALNAANTFTGPLEVLRGSVYLGNTNALVNGNVLILDPGANVNSRLFLYGFNASVSDLQSGGYGNIVIANGNNVTSSNVGPATLTVTENHPTTFAGNILDWYTEYTAPHTGPLSPTLSLVKNGTATLTLSGANSYSGATLVNAGKLYINNSSTGGGAFAVATNATLGGSGVIHSVVTVNNGGTIEGGSGSGVGDLQLGGLILGVNSGDASVLNLTPAAILNLSTNTLVLNGGAGSVTINVGGIITATGAYPLIAHRGTLFGAGFAGFQLGSTPVGIAGYLTNDPANAAIDFVCTQVTTPRWTGALSTEWSTQVLSAPKNWVLDTDGATAIDYQDGENVKFDDTAANPTVNISVANVSPATVTISNVVQNYVFTGSQGVVGTASLTKLGAGVVTLRTVNGYAGNTVIAAGTLALGTAGAIPGGPGAGNVTVNGTLDVAGFSPTLNNLTGNGTVDDLSAGGSPLVTVNEIASSAFAGVLQNTSGSLGLALSGTGTLTLGNSSTYTGPTLVNGGTLVVNGSLGRTAVAVQSGAALGGTGAINGPATLNTGAALDLTANNPLTLRSLSLQGAVTVNVTGNVSTNTTGTYVLLNYSGVNATNLFVLAPVAGIFNSGFTATLIATTNQLTLNVAPTQPTGTIADVKHVVIFMQENRSFDHYYGSLHGVHGYSDHVSLTLPNGNSVFYQPSGSSYELPFHSTVECLGDLDHSWTVTHEAWDNGNWDQWIAAKGPETMTYYNRSDLSYYYSLVDSFTICDEYHCSVMSSTDPNRVTHWTGMIDPNDTGGGPLIDNTELANGWGTNWVTYPELLQKAGITWKVYQASDNYDDNALYWFAAYKDAPAGSPLNVNGTLFAPSIESGTGFLPDYTNLIAEFKGAITSNSLPAVSWIIGPDVGSEHPAWSPEDGEILTKGLLDALASNPKIYNSTVFILNYDENDGFFDHAVPINPPAGTPNEFVGGLPIGLGVRVPCIIVSPWTAGGHVCSQVFDHTSVLRFLEKWTGVYEPNISAWRRQVCGDLTSAFDFAHPNTNYPALTTATVENDCSSGTTVSPPAQQTMPAQEAGTLVARPLPYQPNALAVLDPVTGNVNLVLTNSGSASVHFSVYANAYSTILPTPFDVNPSNTLTGVFSTAKGLGKYDFSAYGPNGFLRRFAGNVTTDFGQADSLAYLNPFTDGFELTLANPGAAPVTFSVTNGWFANSLATYTVPARGTNVVFLDTSTNNGWYDLQVTASNDPLFVRRFAGHIETNNPPAGLLSSENPSGYRDTVAFTANFAGYGTPTGTAQFLTNGVPFGTPVTLSNGVAYAATALLPRTNNVVAVVYSGDSLNPPVTNRLTQVVLDHPPVPATVVYQRAAGQPYEILVSDLLTNVTDADGDPITLVGVGTDGLNLLTTNGVTLSTNASYIIYPNSVIPNVNDSFEYTVSDGYGGISLGTVLIVVNTNYVAPVGVPIILSTTNATVSFFGVPGAQYEIDRSTNLSPDVGSGWVPISTNLAPISGIIQINDGFQDLGLQAPPTPPSAFYRLRPNPWSK